jgi:hypothetical protein
MVLRFAWTVKPRGISGGWRRPALDSRHGRDGHHRAPWGTGQDHRSRGSHAKSGLGMLNLPKPDRACRADALSRAMRLVRWYRLRDRRRGTALIWSPSTPSSATSVDAIVRRGPAPCAADCVHLGLLEPFEDAEPPAPARDTASPGARRIMADSCRPRAAPIQPPRRMKPSG